MKIFENHNFKVKGNVISKESFRLLDFCKKESLDPAKRDRMIADADADLAREIPHLTMSM